MGNGESCMTERDEVAFKCAELKKENEYLLLEIFATAITKYISLLLNASKNIRFSNLPALSTDNGILVSVKSNGKLCVKYIDNGRKVAKIGLNLHMNENKFVETVKDVSVETIIALLRTCDGFEMRYQLCSQSNSSPMDTIEFFIIPDLSDEQISSFYSQSQSSSESSFSSQGSRSPSDSRSSSDSDSFTISAHWGSLDPSLPSFSFKKQDSSDSLNFVLQLPKQGGKKSNSHSKKQSTQKSDKIKWISTKEQVMVKIKSKVVQRTVYTNAKFPGQERIKKNKDGKMVFVKFTRAF
jgi:hypothetical protein